jgi:hypothetical protein
MKFTNAPILILVLSLVTAMKTAIIYRGPSACDDCSESVGRLLKNSPYYFNITYAGPNKEFDLSPELLSQADVSAYPSEPGRISGT